MTRPSNTELREAILQILGIKEKDLAPEPKVRINALVELIQAREQQLLTELKSESLIYYHHVPNVDASTKTEWAVPVSAIEKYREEL